MLTLSRCPCISFTTEEVSLAGIVETSVAPERGVCPTNAITLDPLGRPEVYAESCVGCGLCAIRCPVGAIHLDPTTACAVVSGDETPGFQSVPYEANGFGETRELLSRTFVTEKVPFPDAERVAVQVEKFRRGVDGVSEQRLYRLLVRNAFLSLNLSSRLKYVGDNNAFAELVVSADDDLLLIEVEPSGDVLDAFRRVIVGTAIASSRYQVTLSKIFPCIVVDRLPNARVDYYEAAINCFDRIAVLVRIVPVGILLLAIRSQDDGMLRFIRDFVSVDPHSPNLGPQVARVWGTAKVPGLSPEK